MNGKERNDLRKEKLAGFVYNLASLSFAGLVIGGITPLFSSNTGSVDVSLIVSGTITTGLLAFFANKILK